MAQCEDPGAAINDLTPAPVDIDAPSEPAPESRIGDARSSSAMEELASLMLEMDIEEKGEPSFTIAAGKRKSSARDTHDGHDGLSTNEGNNGSEFVEEVFQLRPEFLSHLVDCFVDHFNTFHQFLAPEDIADLKTRGATKCDLDFCFRNSALLAVAACFSTVPEAKEVRSSYASLADSLALRCIRERPNDVVVQGLALLAWKELMFGAPSLAYNYIGRESSPVGWPVCGR